jgi:hypothetical protein
MQIFGRYARVEKVLVNAIAESYLHGVSAKAVMRNISKKGLWEVAEQLREAYGSKQKLQEVADSLNLRRYQRTATPLNDSFRDP